MVGDVDERIHEYTAANLPNPLRKQTSYSLDLVTFEGYGGREGKCVLCEEYHFLYTSMCGHSCCRSCWRVSAWKHGAC